MKREALGLEGTYLEENYFEERSLGPGRNLIHGGRSLLLRCYGREVGVGGGGGCLEDIMVVEGYLYLVQCKETLKKD